MKENCRLEDIYNGFLFKTLLRFFFFAYLSKTMCDRQKQMPDSERAPINNIN